MQAHGSAGGGVDRFWLDRIFGKPASGRRAATAGDYTAAVRLHHRVVPLIHETFGGLGAAADRHLRWLAKDVAASRFFATGATSWSASSFTSYIGQRLSIAIHRGVFEEYSRSLGARTSAA